MSELIEKIEKYLAGDEIYDVELDFLIKNLLILFEEDEAIIDKMSELMTSPVHSKEWVKNYFRNEVKKECSQ